MASYQPTSLRSFSSDRSHTLSHASYLRDSAMIDDTVVIPSQQVSTLLHSPVGQIWKHKKIAIWIVVMVPCSACCLSSVIQISLISVDI